MGTGHLDSVGRDLRAGDWVEVRSSEEILATLDERGRLEALPFMPEMLQYCGKRFRVYKSAHKTCDTIETYKGRRMTSCCPPRGPPLRWRGARRMSGAVLAFLEGGLAQARPRSGAGGG